MSDQPRKYRHPQLMLVFGLLIFLGFLAIGGGAGQFTNEAALTSVLTKELGLDPEPETLHKIGRILRQSRERHANINAIVGASILVASTYGLIILSMDRQP